MQKLVKMVKILIYDKISTVEIECLCVLSCCGLQVVEYDIIESVLEWRHPDVIPVRCCQRSSDLANLAQLLTILSLRREKIRSRP